MFDNCTPISNMEPSYKTWARKQDLTSKILKNDIKKEKRQTELNDYIS